MAKLLIADDQDDIRGLLREIAEDAGFIVFEARNGESAVEAALRISPDVILMDIKMPGMDGWETMEAVRESGILSEVPVIFCSASREARIRYGNRPPAHSSFLEKPFEPETLKELLDRHSGCETETGD